MWWRWHHHQIFSRGTILVDRKFEKKKKTLWSSVCFINIICCILCFWKSCRYLHITFVCQIELVLKQDFIFLYISCVWITRHIGALSKWKKGCCKWLPDGTIESLCGNSFWRSYSYGEMPPVCWLTNGLTSALSHAAFSWPVTVTLL